MTANQRVDLSKAHNAAIVRARMQDEWYRPFCMRCSGIQRMQEIEPYLWQHKCGAVHDERQVLQ